MDNKNEKINILAVNVISSALCNLDCSFCYLTKNEAYKDYSKIVRKAWQDGSYVDNIEKTLLKLNADFSKVEGMQLWGGETLLYIKDLIPNVPKLLKMFPNCKRFNLSSNWTTSIEDYFNFLVEVDKVINKPIHFLTQFSIDGPTEEYTKNGHPVEWETYYKNCDLFFELMNHHRFQNVYIDLVVNATLSQELYLNNFIQEEKMIEYVGKMREFSQYLYDNCVSKNLECLSTYIFPGYALPHETTSEQGRQLTNILKLWDKVRIQHFNDCSPYYHFGYGIGAYAMGKDYFSPQLECGEMNNSITIGPDGTIVECTGSFIDHYHNYQQILKDTNNDHEYYASKTRERYAFNPQQMTDEELKEHIWFLQTGYINKPITTIHMSLSVLKELALSGQIDNKYVNNEELLLKHLLNTESVTACPKENLRDTAVSFLPNVSCFRKFFNGTAEYSYEKNKEELQLIEMNKIKNKLKGEQICNNETSFDPNKSRVKGEFQWG